MIKATSCKWEIKVQTKKIKSYLKITFLPTVLMFNSLKRHKHVPYWYLSAITCGTATDVFIYRQATTYIKKHADKRGLETDFLEDLKPNQKSCASFFKIKIN